MRQASRVKDYCSLQGWNLRSTHDGKRELVTVIEGVAANGTIAPRFLIYAGTGL